MKLRFIFLFLVLLALVGTSEAATLTVCGSGCDYNYDGTDDQIEINYALDNASVGDRVENTGYANISDPVNITKENGVNDSITFSMSGNGQINSTLDNLQDEAIYIHNVNGTILLNPKIYVGYTANPTGDDQQLIWVLGNDTVIDGANFTQLAGPYATTAARHSKSVRFGNASTSSYYYNGTIRNSSVWGVTTEWFYYASVYNITSTRSRGFGVDFNGHTMNSTFHDSVTSYNTNDNAKIYSDTRGNSMYNITSIAGEYGVSIRNGPKDNRIWNFTIRNSAKGGFHILSQTSGYNNSAKNILIYDVPYGITAQGVGTCCLDVNFSEVTIYNATYDGVINNNTYVYSSTFKNIIIEKVGRYGLNIYNGATLNATYVLINNTGSGAYNGTGITGYSNTTGNPLFVNATYGSYDFHLQSVYGHWNGSAWVTDASTSPAIDAGDPSSDYSKETEPNGNRINMGAYGNTVEASLSATTDVPPSIPGIPINIASTYGKYWINTTWQAAEGNVTTDSYNVSVNGTWYNGTLCTCINITTISGNYTNVSVWAFNNSGAGNVSTSYINLNTTLLLYSISGYVTDAFGLPIPSVSVVSSDGSNTTNTAGYYVISDQLNGSYSLSFSKSGYTTDTLSVTISGSDATNQNIMLTATIPATWSELEDHVSVDWATWSAVMAVAVIISIIAIVLFLLNSGVNIDAFQMLAIAGIVLAILIVLFGIIPVIGYSLDTAFDGMVR